MSAKNPYAERFVTHAVDNQVPPLSVDAWRTDAVLREAVTREGGGWADDTLAAYGKLAGGELQEHATLANAHKPELRLFDLAEIDACLQRNRGQRGAKRLRAAIADLRPADPRKIRSELERGVLKLIDRHDLPRPAVNLNLHGFEVDLHWPHHRVAVELDAWGTHGTRAAFERDHARDLHLQRHGWRVVRISWRQWRREPDTVAAALQAVLRP